MTQVNGIFSVCNGRYMVTFLFQKNHIRTQQVYFVVGPKYSVHKASPNFSPLNPPRGTLVREVNVSFLQIFCVAVVKKNHNVAEYLLHLKKCNANPGRGLIFLMINCKDYFDCIKIYFIRIEKICWFKT